MMCRYYPSSLLPLQFLGMRSLIRYGLETIGFASYFLQCCVDAAQHVNSATDCLVHFLSQLLYHVCHFLSQLLEWSATRSAVVTMSVHESTAGGAAGAAAAVLYLASKTFERFHP